MFKKGNIVKAIGAEVIILEVTKDNYKVKLAASPSSGAFFIPKTGLNKIGSLVSRKARHPLTTVLK